jgi:hypothetical protein
MIDFDEKEKPNSFKKIGLWWKFSGRYYHSDFIQGVKNLWKWFPTIWKDRDWDQGFIYEIIKVKLKNQSDYIGSRNTFISTKRNSELMKLTTRLIQRCQDDFYELEIMDYQEIKLKFVPTDETEKWFRMEDTIVSERFDEYFKKYPLQYKRVLSGEINRFDREAEEKEKIVIGMEIAHENQERCRKLLFKIMERHIDGWWD